MLPVILAPILSMLADKGMTAVTKMIEGGADKALATIADKTGIDLTTVTSETLTPEQEEKLRAFDLEMRKLEIQEGKMYLEDTASARDMQKTALGQEDTFSKRYVYYLASAWSLFAIVYIICITFCTIPAGNVRFADTILGFLLGTIVAQIMNYFFGSSSGSKAKTDLLNKKPRG